MFSIPAINFFTHGTHTTVAHSMGTTIGINTTILMASLLYLAGQSKPATKRVINGYWIFNISLLVFWASLLIAGVKKSLWQYFTQRPFGELHDELYGVFVVFLLSGVGILLGLSLIASYLIPALAKKNRQKPA